MTPQNHGLSSFMHNFGRSKEPQQDSDSIDALFVVDIIDEMRRMPYNMHQETVYKHGSESLQTTQ